MVKYNILQYIDGYEEELLVCELSDKDILEVENEFSSYMKYQGKIYEMDIYKHPNVKNFFKLYFGECEADVCGEYWITPDRYICSSISSADRFMKIAKHLNYHDRYNQTFCTVEKDKETINIYYGDY